MSEPDVSNLLTVAQAIAIIDCVPVAPLIERLPISQALGLYLAEDVVADRDYPPFDKSLMDGYAVRAADVAAVPVELRLIGEVAAGGEASRTLGVGETMAIMTGAPLPAGADGVVPIEETSREGDVIRIEGAERPGRFIARRGADRRAGEIVLRRGVKLEAAQIAVAATVGATELEVHPRVRVAVLSTGDEIVPIDAMPGGAQIRNSNSLMLGALLRRMGCEVTDLGIARDDRETIRAAIARGQAYDVLFITGGMSMGAYDYVPGLLKEMRYDLRITKLRIKPGKPFVFGVLEGSGLKAAGSKSAGQTNGTGAFVFGLPGNPVSGFACTVRLASRLLVRLAGGEPMERWLSARLTQALPANGAREFYQPAALTWAAEGLLVTPLAWKGSADLFTFAAADALLVRGEDEGALPIGAAVRIMEI
jgi:molybdopterin molybdotransferase